MKTFLSLSMMLAVSTLVNGEFSTWIRADRKTAELKFFSMTETPDGKSGSFKMHKGNTVALATNGFSALDAKRNSDRKLIAEAPISTPSVFDKDFDDNLVKLDSQLLKAYKDPSKSAKYYLFYYTASWFAPCGALHLVSSSSTIQNIEHAMATTGFFQSE